MFVLRPAETGAKDFEYISSFAVTLLYNFFPHEIAFIIEFMGTTGIQLALSLDRCESDFMWSEQLDVLVVHKPVDRMLMIRRPALRSLINQNGNESPPERESQCPRTVLRVRV